MFSFDTKVRYSELNKDGIVRPEAIVNYLQDCTTFHSGSIGAGLDFYKNMKKAWILNAWQIEIKEQIQRDEEIVIGTWPYDFQGAYGHRNFVIKNKEGKNIVEANTLWVLADMETGRPVKATEEYTRFYALEERLDMDYADRKIKLPTEVIGEKMEPFAVKKAYIDTNYHTNNARYIECAAEYIPDGYMVKRIRAEYKMQSRLGDVFYPVVYNDDNKRITVALNNKEGKIYATVEFDIYK